MPDLGAIQQGAQLPVIGNRYQATPAYIAALAPFEVSQLGSPTNGFATIQSLTPAEWIGPGKPAARDPDITSPWSGGVGDGANRYLYVHGGGHNDAANNGLYRFDFGGGANWNGGVLLDISAVADVPNVAGVSYRQYNDGRPPSIHSYGGLFIYDGNFYRDAGKRMAWRRVQSGLVEV